MRASMKQVLDMSVLMMHNTRQDEKLSSNAVPAFTSSEK